MTTTTDQHGGSAERADRADCLGCEAGCHDCMAEIDIEVRRAVANRGDWRTVAEIAVHVHGREHSAIAASLAYCYGAEWIECRGDDLTSEREYRPLGGIGDFDRHVAEQASGRMVRQYGSHIIPLRRLTHWATGQCQGADRDGDLARDAAAAIAAAEHPGERYTLGDWLAILGTPSGTAEPADIERRNERAAKHGEVPEPSPVPRADPLDALDWLSDLAHDAPYLDDWPLGSDVRDALDTLRSHFTPEGA